ncbi:MAG: hypothetical protein HOP19_07160 [Acidobacteria bacterium]|nr:hypothetical protein [Acidobacteriota bacterium]
MNFSLERRSRFIKALGLAVLLVAGLALLFRSVPSANANAQGSVQPAPDFVPVAAVGGDYIIREENGQRVCQEATPAESQQLRANSAQNELRVIYDGRANAVAAGAAQTGLRITLRATAQLDAAPEAKTAFIRAAQNWEAQILSPISIVVDVDYGTTFFGEAYSNANIIGATSSQNIGGPTAYGGIRAALIASASSAAETALYGVLPVGELPTDQGNLTAVFADASVFRALGLINPNANPDTEQAQLGRPAPHRFQFRFLFRFRSERRHCSDPL